MATPISGHSGFENVGHQSSEIDLARFGAAEGSVERLRADSFSCHQLPPHKKQVAEREQREDMRAVLRETAVAGVEVTELALDHAERMLDAGTIWG